MVSRIASCRCGQLTLRCDGEPTRVSICHCLACQKRSGSVFAVQARLSCTQVTIGDGAVSRYEQRSDSGATVSFFFCPHCGATVYWQHPALPDSLIVAVGAFADPDFPPPSAFTRCWRTTTCVVQPRVLPPLDGTRSAQQSSCALLGSISHADWQPRPFCNIRSFGNIRRWVSLIDPHRVHPNG